MSFVEWIGVTVVCFIAIGAAGFVINFFGMKDEKGDYPNDGLKAFGNYVFFIVVMCVVFFTLVNIG